MTKPGPRPLGRNLKTTVRILGDVVDEFQGLCHLLRRRPHELAADLVLEGIRRYREDPDVGPRLAVLVEERRRQWLAQEQLAQGRERKGLRLLSGGDR